MRWIASPLLATAGMIAGPLLYLFSILGPSEYRGRFWVAVSETFLSFPGALGVLLLGLALLALDIHVYERRRSYIEDSNWPY